MSELRSTYKLVRGRSEGEADSYTPVIKNEAGRIIWRSSEMLSSRRKAIAAAVKEKQRRDQSELKLKLPQLEDIVRRLRPIIIKKAPFFMIPATHICTACKSSLRDGYAGRVDSELLHDEHCPWIALIKLRNEHG